MNQCKCRWCILLVVLQFDPVERNPERNWWNRTVKISKRESEIERNGACPNATINTINICLSGLLPRRQNAWSQDDGNMGYTSMTRNNRITTQNTAIKGENFLILQLFLYTPIFVLSACLQEDAVCSGFLQWYVSCRLTVNDFTAPSSTSTALPLS